MTLAVERLIALSQPFADWFAASPNVQIGVSFLHFGGLLASGGLALASDRAVLRLGADPDPARKSQLLNELAHVHRPVLIGLTLVLITGLALSFADLEVYLGSTVYWVKMGLIALLLANGALLGQTGESLAAHPDGSARRWTTLRVASVTSVALWLTITFVGVMLTNS